ncbi:MAG: hypothetical protein ACJAZ2_001750 [Glaciecola sp.]|jgi:hypothetical protein
MKKLTLLFFLLTISLGYSQVVLENFSSGITTSNWKGDSGLGSATVETLDPNGLVGKIVTSTAAGANPWQNAQLYMQSNRINLSTTNKVVTVAVYSTTAFDMFAKVVDGIVANGDAAPESAAATAHTGSGWETLSFDFAAPTQNTPAATGEYARILFFPLWNISTGEFKAVAVTTTYVDNITGLAGAAIAAAPGPPSAGPANPPARSTSDYISFYNGIVSPVAPQYTNVAGVIFDKFGTQTTIEDLALADNIVKKYTNHNYSGIGGGDVDVSAMTKLHLDVYSPNFTSFKIKFEAVNGTNKEIEVPFTKTKGAWNSYDVDLSTYAGVDLAHLKWIVPVTNAGTTMYVDNVYFYKAASGKIATLSDLKVDGVTVSGFAAGTLNYAVVLPKGTTAIPQITAVTKTNSSASEVTTQATAIPGDAKVVVTSEDGTVTATYTVSYSIDASTACAGTSKEVPTNGTTFSKGYTYKFETLANGTDVKVTFTVLDTDKPGISNVELVRNTNTFTAMTLVSGQQYTVTIAGQVAGTELLLAGKFPYEAGGVVQTKNFKYNVGDNCSTGNTDAKDATLTDLKVDALTVAGFVPGKLTYSVVLPKGTTTIPQITSVTKTNSSGSHVITQAAALPGDATVVVTSQDGSVTATYTVSFTVDASTACAGTSKEASEGTYSTGYKYNFVTSGTDVMITFELLDTDKAGFSPQVYFQAPEKFVNMTNPSGQIYKATLADNTAGVVLKFAIRGAYAGGLVTSKFFEYTVGDSCENKTTVTIDGSSELKGYLNWFFKDGTYASGGEWAMADVKTVSDATNDKVTLSPNFNTYDAGNAYWSDGAGKGNKIVEGNSFIENRALAGQILTFNGDVASNTLAAGYTAIAFIKGLDESKGFEDVLKITAPLVSGESFSITTATAIPAGLIVQYGFTIKGLNGNPDNEVALGTVVIGKASLSTAKFEASNVRMYPNPVRNNLTIEANSTIERVSVYNILGQEVLTTRPAANAATLQTSNLQKGIYIVKTEIDGKVSASKIIKE